MVTTASLNLVSYISATTGCVAEIELDDNNFNRYRFKSSPEIVSAREEYIKQMREEGELNVDLVKFSSFIRHYKRATRASKVNKK